MKNTAQNSSVFNESENYQTFLGIQLLFFLHITSGKHHQD